VRRAVPRLLSPSESITLRLNQVLALLPTLPICALHDNIFELNGHREAGVDLEPDGSATWVGGICVVGGLRPVEPDLEAASAGTDTEGIPLAFLEQGSDALAAASLRIDIALGARVETAGHVDLEGVRLAQLDLELGLAEKDPRIHDASPHDF
jgi:hypothetical protein